jgi:hypothetical protein
MMMMMMGVTKEFEPCIVPSEANFLVCMEMELVEPAVLVDADVMICEVLAHVDEGGEGASGECLQTL